MNELELRGERRRGQFELVLFFLVALIFLSSGIGLRDPWPADEPRFVLVARDMVETGEWFFPRVGGELYQDKPPLFFWIMAAAITATGSVRLAFLLPSLFAALGVLGLVYDLGRRWWSHRTGLIASATLLVTLQFVLEAKVAQIDMMLCFFATFAVYGMARHLRDGPSWPWYLAGCAAMGAGVITKGVGFLPLLLLIPYGWAVYAGWPKTTRSRSLLWIMGPVVMLMVISAWLVPMVVLVANSGDVTLEAYRNEILLKQTAERYAAPWGHIKPWWYFPVNVIPSLWLPLSIALPWLIPQWWKSIREKDLRIFLLVGWAVLAVLFFSASAGKRGVYVLIALPAVALAASPWIEELWERRGVHRAAFFITVCATAMLSLGALETSFSLLPDVSKISSELGVSLTPFLLLFAFAGLIAIALFGVRRGAAGLIGFTSILWVAMTLWVAPSIDEARSGRQFVHKLERVTSAGGEIGIVRWKEQFLLQSHRPVTHFGHRRSDRNDENHDAIAWLLGRPNRRLVVDAAALGSCFERGQFVDEAHGERWYVVSAADVLNRCMGKGDATLARMYTPPFESHELPARQIAAP